jgi:hypothetical protein
LFRYLDAGGFLADALVIHGAATQRAIRPGDRAEAGAIIKALAGDVAAARAHWEQALARYAELDAPDARRIRARLAATDPARSP